jgi:hypothetical protein
MRELEHFLVFTNPLEALGLRYFVTGSIASIVYGEPRLTHDIDLVLHLSEGDIDRLLGAYPEEQFYLPPKESLELEVRRDQRGHFNLIHLATGYKADVYLFGNHPLHQWAFSRRRRIALEPIGQLWLAPPEYVILRKMEYFREGGSDKHLRDIQGMLAVSGEQINQADIEQWVPRLGLENEWKKFKGR